MPYFSKSVPTFNGERLPESKSWLESEESAATLHNWPSAFTLDTARTHLVGAARYWYEARRDRLTSWQAFRAEFSNTFILKDTTSSLWKNMSSRVQNPKEDLSLYFHEKVQLCNKLNLPFEESKEQIVIGLASRELATMIISKSQFDLKDLLHDLIVFNRIVSERRSRHGVFDRKQEQRAEVKHERRAEVKPPTTSQPVRQYSTATVRCFNCNQQGHLSLNCRKPKRERGSCFECGSMEHRLSSWTRRAQEVTQEVSTPRTTTIARPMSDTSLNLVEKRVDIDLLMRYQ